MRGGKVARQTDKRSLFLLFLLLAFNSCYCIAQKVKVITQDGDTVPYLYFVSSGGKYYLSSDSYGFIDISNVSLPDTTAFMVYSDFYSSEPASLLSLRSLNAIIVRYKTEHLREIYIMPEDSLMKLLGDASRLFSKRYLKDYVATLGYRRKIYSGEQLVQQYLVYGLWGSLDFNQNHIRHYWDDRNLMGVFGALDSFVSEFHLSGKKSSAGPNKVVNQSVSDADFFNVNYVNEFSLRALDIKRTVEIYSPLNEKYVKDYSYRLESISNENGVQIYTIVFKTKSNKFPGHTKLLGTGKIVLTEDCKVLQVELENAEDRYTSFIRNKEAKAGVLLTPYKWSVRYVHNEQGIFTASVKMAVTWNTPQKSPLKRGDYYYIEWNPYRRPFENRLKTETDIVFSEIVPIVNIKQKEKIRGFLGSSFGAGATYYAVETVNHDFWVNVLKNNLRLGLIKLDPCSPDFESLYQQAVRSNEINRLEYSENKNKNNPARILYKEIYNKEYYE